MFLASGSAGGGAAGGIEGSTGATDDAVLLADGTGGAATKPSNLFASETGEAGMIKLGGTTAGQVGIKHHQGSVIIAQARTADDSAHAALSGLRPCYNLSSDSTIGSDVTAPDAVITNRTNSTAEKIITLPAVPLNGESYTFINVDADGLKVQAAGSQLIYIGTSVSSAGGTVASTDVCARLDLVYIGQRLAWVGLISGSWVLA
jgi:hypothetical protein